MKDFQRFVSSHHCIQMNPKLESRTNSDELDVVTSRPTDEVSRDSYPKPAQFMLTGSTTGACLEACLDNFEIPPPEKPADYIDTGKCKGVEINDDHESFDSVEGSDNVRTNPAGKRKCEFTSSMRSSKLQKLSDGNASCSEIFLEKGSSFMKWIRNLMNGLSEFNLDRNLLCENSHKAMSFEHKHNDLRKTDSDRALWRTRSFQSFFHAMYSPSLRLHDKKLESFDCNREMKELLDIEETNKAPFGEGSNTSYGKNKLHLQTNIVNPPNRYNHGIDKISSCSASPLNHEKHKSSLEGNGISCNIACVLGKDCDSSSNNAEKPACGIMNGGGASSSELAANSKSLSRNLWLARFSPSKVALKTREENAGMNTSKAVDVASGGHSLGQDCVYTAAKRELIAVDQPFSSIHLDDCISGMNICESRINKKNWHPKQSPLVQPAGSCIKVLGTPASDQEFYNNSSMLCSSMGKDLSDHMRTFPSTSKVMTGVVCFFCGAVGHSIRGCAEMAKYKYPYPLKRTTSWESEKDSCFCICCFGLDHWAISCPQSIRFASVVAAGPVDLGRVENVSKHDPLEIQNGTSSSQPAAIGSNYWFCNMQNTKVVNPTPSTAEMNVRDVEMEKDRVASSSGYCEPTENRMMPYLGRRNGEIPTVHLEMLNKIRKLQLSRSDILR